MGYKRWGEEKGLVVSDLLSLYSLLLIGFLVRDAGFVWQVVEARLKFLGLILDELLEQPSG